MLRRQQRRLLWEWFKLNPELRRKYNGKFHRFVRAVESGAEPIIDDGILQIQGKYTF
jgi:hypothetical protein